MKAVVTECFIDKLNGKVYEVGETVVFDDEKRIKDLTERKLIELIETEVSTEKPKRKKASK